MLDHTFAGRRTVLINRAMNHVRQQSDINEHLPYLYSLGIQYNHITEFGVRYGVSTTSFISGLINYRANGKHGVVAPGKLISYDVVKNAEVDALLALAPEVFTFHQASSLDVEITDTDVLFIDTLHTSAQLLRELLKHHHNVRSLIVMHDTVTFGEVGEDGKKPGLMGAIRAFLDAHPHWVIMKHQLNNNGLMTLKRLNKNS